MWPGLYVSFFSFQVTGEGTKFWSGPKRPPQPLSFDANDDLHMDFVLAAANLYAASLGLPQKRDRTELRRMAGAVQATSGFCFGATARCRSFGPRR